MNKFWLASLIAISLGMCVLSESAWASPSLIIVGKKEAVVLAPVITLGDIADVSSPMVADDQTIIGLREIELQKSPAPGDKTTLSAARILEIIDRAGFDRSNFGYSFPRIMTVQRASRLIEAEDLRPAIEEAIAQTGRDISVGKIKLTDQIRVTPGPVEFSAALLSTRNSLMIMTVSISLAGERDIRVNVPVEVKEWSMIPVAARSIAKGEVLRESDITKARLNIGQLPSDATVSEAQIIGHEVSLPLNPGDTFRSKTLKIPPIINAGSKVTLLVKEGYLRATASGVALEPGIQGQTIRVQNDTSKRVVMAEVVEPGLVHVSSYAMRIP